MQALDQPLETPAVIVTLRGDYDLARKDEVRLELSVAQAARLAIVDLSGAGFMDSTCLGEIVRLAWSVISSGGKVRVVAPHPHQKKIFNLLGLAKKIELFDSLADAGRVAA